METIDQPHHTSHNLIMANGDKQLHIVMFPWAGFGHMINFLELSKFIAQKGHKVSFVSTARNIDRLPKINSPLVTFVKLNLPRVDGLPENAEASMDIGMDDIPLLIEATDGLETELTRFLMAESPDWIIHDFIAHWVPRVAAKLGISRAYFSIFTAWFLTFTGSSSDDMINARDVRKTTEDWMAPPPWVPFPSKLELKFHEATAWASGGSLTPRAGSVIGGSDAILIRHCMEFEPQWIGLLEKLHNKPVIPVGFMPPSVLETRDDNDGTWLKIKEWLDGQNKGSVVYIALGSEAQLTQDQLSELALGLELSGLPFIWALRKSHGSAAELPDGFLERTKCRGMVWTGWAPQLKILGHDSVGGFLNHGGWSSAIEGLMLGKPLIMLPIFGDQGPNARILADKKLGIEIPRNMDGSFSRNSVADSLSLVMVEDEGRTFKAKAKDLSSINGDMELHNKYIDNVVNFLETHRAITLANGT